MTAIANTDASGETIDPQSAHLFADGIGQLATMLTAKIEGAHGDLVARGVSGEPIACLDQMIDAAAALIAESQKAKAYFQEHLGVQEHIEAVNHVGGDEYLRGGARR